MWPSLPQQKTGQFSILESENIDMGTANIEIAEFLLTEELFTPGAEMTCHLDLDQDYMLTIRAWANMMKEKMGYTAVTGVSVPIIM